jgi:predicted nucleotidyltransferase
MSVDRDRVLEILAAHGEEFRAMGVKHLFLFGSLARGEATDGSDVDVLVEYEPGTKLSFFRVSRLRYRLEELLQARVDLVTTGGLRDEIRDAVMSEAIRAA